MTDDLVLREEDDRERLHWILDHLPASRPGRPIVVLDLGCAEGDLSLLLAERGDRVTGVDVRPPVIMHARRRCERLPSDVASRMDFAVGDGHKLDEAPDSTFDAAAVGGLLDHVGDPVQVLTELHRTLRPGATLVFTVPYGVTDAVLRLAEGGDDEPAGRPAGGGTDHAGRSAAGGADHAGPDGHAGPEAADDEGERRRVFYHGSLRHLVEPLFEIRELTVLRGHLAGVAVRRDEARGTPGFALSRAETAFLHRERLLHTEIAELRARCAETAARERTLARAREDLSEANGELRAEAVRLRSRVRHLEGRLVEYREVIARLRGSRAWRLVTAYRRLRHPDGGEPTPPPAAAQKLGAGPPG
ncbi:class I SAM-dependent methyltransferase [Sphaerisporangium corydalis]|uniref:Methyltransferase domain-containing protein n=1 Tax=Sphaerisporangium corydalis TaxID=1441875 RepID=A0ABV9EK88_9ACTN|nr:methyltransferase domain-containing protein [Sphaerisporangium corydalis]